LYELLGLHGRQNMSELCFLSQSFKELALLSVKVFRTVGSAFCQRIALHSVKVLQRIGFARPAL